jgi:lipoprotein-anchoring transpeptidase ErfK/SrfK
LQQAAQQTSTQPLNVPIVHGKKESFKGLDANAINAAPVNLPITGDVRGPSVLRTQVYLDRAHFSVGAIDGRWGRNSAITVWWWQKAHGLETTGDVDEATFRSIAQAAGGGPAVTTYTLTANDTKGPFVHVPDDPYEKAKLDCLCYESLREELAERFHSTEDFLDVLNPGITINDLQAGATINAPNVRAAMTQDQPDIAKVIISIVGNSYNAFDAAGNVIFHAPTTLGSTYDPSPDETLHVVAITRLPHFHYDPTLYHEVPDTEPDAHLNPGPNSPVGVVWMALSKQHYGMHGTPDPDSIGYASSHGCVRLTNWDADEVSHRISKGVPVSFLDTTSKHMPDVTKK